MAAYDLEEQEKIAELKAWWQQWGPWVTAGLAALLVAYAAIQGWRWWQGGRVEQAAALYAAVSEAARGNDAAKAKDAAAQLADRFSGTGYAPRGLLVYAKLLYDAGDKAGARAQLQWVIDRSGEDELKQVARFRLAELLIDDRQYDEALRVLDAKHAEPFAGLYADLRGDALASAGRTEEARIAYHTSLAKLDAKSPYRNYVQVKLDAIGGPPASPPPAVAKQP